MKADFSSTIGEAYAVVQYSDREDPFSHPGCWAYPVRPPEGVAIELNLKFDFNVCVCVFWRVRVYSGRPCLPSCACSCGGG